VPRFAPQRKDGKLLPSWNETRSCIGSGSYFRFLNGLPPSARYTSAATTTPTDSNIDAVVLTLTLLRVDTDSSHSLRRRLTGIEMRPNCRPARRPGHCSQTFNPTAANSTTTKTAVNQVAISQTPRLLCLHDDPGQLSPGHDQPHPFGYLRLLRKATPLGSP
jgi:hypothetical protein